ncbi:putative RNA methyltransferase [Amycolatopsis sp. cg5]|uniref:putative RNA methyltransferase n=1 Tax=Amycolatopsis sp. cg5 TaxID=3238802 RepID=UPI003524AF6C
MTSSGHGNHLPPPAVLDVLLCSVCGNPLVLTQRTLRCELGHSFDVAKQGYVNLLHARIPAGTADTPDMVAARVAFLGSGVYTPLADELAKHATEGLVVDAGAGTGYYLARVLDAVPASHGLALDVSAVALRRAARAHERLGAAVWNLWEPWPVASGSASLVLNVFAPRNGPEFHRVLRPGGKLVVAVPNPGHLGELRDLIVSVDDRKEERLDATLAEYVTLESRTEVTRTVTLSPEQIRQVVGMGPSAHHLHKDGRADQLASITEPVDVTTSFTVSAYRR